MNASPIAGDLHVEAARLVDLIADAGVEARLTGGLAIARRCPSAHHPPLARAYADVDLVCATSATKRLGEVLVAAGYVSDTPFNSLHGNQRLYFHDPAYGRHIDVFVGVIRMCHEIDLRQRVTLLPDTVTPSDLLLSKLQIVELNNKDALDLIALLRDQPLAEGDHSAIDATYLAALWGENWPLWRTSQLTLRKVEATAKHMLDPEARDRVIDMVKRLDELLANGPKSRRWKMRARVGDRVRWYELPEEIEE
jgi:hypothetical protein